MDAEVLAQLLAFVEQTTDFVGVSDPWGRIQYLNPAALKRLGVADATDLTLADLFPLEAFGIYYEVVRPQLLRTGAWTGEVLVNASGSGAIPMYVSTTAKLGPGGETNGGVVYAHELSRVDPARATSESDVDEVTGLLARAAFDDRVRLALAAAHRDGESCALVLAEIFDMSVMIETVGVLTAASVMRALAGRMTRLARTIDIVGRVGEDQLGLLLRGVHSHGEALRIARTVYESLVDPPVTTAGGEVAVSVGCGVAFSKPGDDPVDLIRQASATISHETPTRDVDVDTPIAISDRPESAITMDDFRVGMSHGHVRAYAQPVVDLASGGLVGFRAVARWHHRTLGTLKAAAFIDIIAETPLANEVDLYVARETAAVLVVTTTDTPLRLYTPVSKRLIADVRAEQYLSEIADAFFLSMNQIRLQLARPLLDNWSPALHDALQSLSDADVALVLTGVEDASDAQDLAEYGFHELHLSRRLTHAAATDPDARRAVSELVRLAHDRGCLVGAAGVDHQQEQHVLLDCGCDLATGDLYGRPEPVDTID
jgi:diguanylate cyclase (GGDEF)-like protein